jgi:hypothetical protein
MVSIFCCHAVYNIITFCAGQNERKERGGWSVTGWLLKTPVSGDRKEITSKENLYLNRGLNPCLLIWLIIYMHHVLALKSVHEKFNYFAWYGVGSRVISKREMRLSLQSKYK